MGDTEVGLTLIVRDEPAARAVARQQYLQRVRKVLAELWQTHSSLLKHCAQEHPAMPKVTKQTFSKRLKKVDWPIAETIIRCGTHGDEPRRQRLLAELAGLYQAAEGEPPKGYDGDVTTPTTVAPGDDPAEQVRQLRSHLEDLTA
ncbi:MAG TPA: hypothetical protein VK453_13520 [Micromonosporaceae bacterium]|nr:hypothetical protein [Micromonosporaceae bacterium]